MSPEEAIAGLDRALEAAGETVTLRRETAGPGAMMLPLSVTCRATVRFGGAPPAEGFDAQGAATVVLSPTEMDERQWPWPPRAGDKVEIAGFDHMVREVRPFRLGGKLVRVELGIVGPHARAS